MEQNGEMESEGSAVNVSGKEKGDPMIVNGLTMKAAPTGRYTEDETRSALLASTSAVSTRRTEAPLKSPVDEIERTLCRDRRVTRSRVDKKSQDNTD